MEGTNGADGRGWVAEDMAMDGSSPFGERDSTPQPGSLMSGGAGIGAERWDPLAEDPNRGRVWSKILWMGILLVSLGIFGMQVAGQSALTANPTPEPSGVPSMELRYAARVNFGMVKLQDSLGLPPGAGGAADLSQMLRDSSTGPIELLRAAIVAAAANGDQRLATRFLEQATSELDNLERTLDLPSEAEAVAQREAWFEELRLDLEDVRTAVSGMDGAALDRDTRDRLAARHGDFGKMIPVIGAPDTSPLRQDFEDRGVRTLIAVFVMMGIAGLAFLVGFVLFVIALVLVIQKKVRPRLNVQGHWSHWNRTLLLEAFLLFLVSFIAVSIVAGLIEAATGHDLTMVLIWLLLLTAFWPLVRGMSWRDLHLALGWHANGAGAKGVVKEACLGVVGYLAGLPIVLAFVVLSFLLIALTQSKPSHPAATEAMNADFWTAVKLFVLASLWAPIVEETVFRGLLYYNMRKWARPVLSALVVAFIFAIIHPQGLALVPALMGLAVVFALMREWRGSMIGPMVAHGLHNAFVISLVIFVLGA